MRGNLKGTVKMKRMGKTSKWAKEAEKEKKRKEKEKKRKEKKRKEKKRKIIWK